MKGENLLLEVNGLTKIFTDDYGVKKKIIENLAFSIPISSHKITSILAPFGAGKTTLLKIICGIEAPNEGNIIVKGEKYLQADGKIVLIPENSASLPWLSVKENIELAAGLESCRKISDGYKSDEILSLVGLTGYENHLPQNNGFGFRFRINLAMALLLKPVVLLLDDCFKKMDTVTRDEIYSLVKEISNKVDTHFLLCSTNVLEAVRLSERIFLMRKEPGRIFKEIEMGDQINSSANGENTAALRDMIEKSFIDEKQLGTINFSI
jgi:ABC-type nitrate/sulfonate/bicarbonate transport system ATPase subunit